VTRDELIAERDRLVSELSRMKRMEAFERQKARGDFNQEYSNVSPSSFENFGAGIGAGAHRMGAGIGNLLGLVDDSTINDLDARDKNLRATGAGAAGSLVGEVAATLPVGGVLGAGAKALGRSALGRTMASLPGRAATEGALIGAAASSPDDQGSGAAIGAAGGGTLGLLGQGVGRLGTGLVRKSKEAKNLQLMLDNAGEQSFIPVAQGGSEGDFVSRLVKSGYKEWFPYTPGVRGQYVTQANRLGDSARNAALKEGDYLGVLAPDDFKSPTVAIEKLRKANDKVYDSTVKGYTFRLDAPDVRRADMSSAIIRMQPDIDRTSLNNALDVVDDAIVRYSDGGGQISGNNLLNAKNFVSQRMREMKTGTDIKATEVAQDYLETILGQQMQPDDLARYRAANANYQNLLSLESAVDKGSKGLFTPGQLASSAKTIGADDMRYIGETGADVLDNKIGMPGAAGRWGAEQMSGPLHNVFGQLAGPLGLGSVNALATKPVQKFAYGDTKLQQKLVEALRNNPNATEFAGLASRLALYNQIAGE